MRPLKKMNWVPVPLIRPPSNIWSSSGYIKIMNFCIIFSFHVSRPQFPSRLLDIVNPMLWIWQSTGKSKDEWRSSEAKRYFSIHRVPVFVPSSELDPSTPFSASYCVSPLVPKGGGGISRIRVRRWGDPIRTTGREAWYSVYSVIRGHTCGRGRGGGSRKNVQTEEWRASSRFWWFVTSSAFICKNATTVGKLFILLLVAYIVLGEHPIPFQPVSMYNFLFFLNF